MRVGELMITAQMERMGRRIGPNDSVVGAVLLRTKFGPEEETVLVGR
jgi:hypothetical protein